MTTLVAPPERSRSRPSGSAIERAGRGSRSDRGGSDPASTSRIAVGNVNAVTYEPRTDSERSVIVYWWIGWAGRLVHAEEHDPAAQGGVLDRPSRSGCPTASTTTSAPIGQEVPPSLHPVRPGCTTTSAPTALATAARAGLRLHHDDRVRARRLEHREEEAADRPGAEDDRRLTGPRVRLVDAVHDAGQRLDERRRSPVEGASDSGNTASAGALTSGASAPWRKTPSARTFSQLAGRPARQGPQTPHFGSGSTTTRWPIASASPRATDARGRGR